MRYSVVLSRELYVEVTSFLVAASTHPDLDRRAMDLLRKLRELPGREPTLYQERAEVEVAPV